MSSEDFVRANFRKFDVIDYLQAFGLEDAESAKKLFKRTIDHLVTQKPCPLRKWAKDIKDTNYAIISSTTALDHFIKQSKKRAKQLQHLQILSDRMQDTSARARVTKSLAQEDDRPDGGDTSEHDRSGGDTSGHDQNGSYLKRLKYEFKQTFDAMPDQHKWKLSTGTVVEDALFEFGMKLTKEHLVHSFVLDTLDSVYVDQEVFSKEELQEISQFEAKPLAKVPQQLKDYINTFAVNDCQLLRQKIDAVHEWQTGYDLKTKGDFDWVRNTVYNLVREYEANSYLHDHLEGWYTVHLWRLFDTVFDGLQDIEVSRGEPPSRASADRRNNKRKLGGLEEIKRKKIGHRCDAIVQRLNPNNQPQEEYGASEIAKSFDQYSTKVLYERDHKLPKTLRDMFNSLCSSYPSAVRQIQAVGYIHHGLSCALLIMDAPRGHVARVKHIPEDGHWLSVAPQIEKFKDQTIPVLLLAWQAKEIVSKVINDISSTNNDDPADSSWLDNVFSSPNTIVMPTCSTSEGTLSKKQKNSHSI